MNSWSHSSLIVELGIRLTGPLVTQVLEHTLGEGGSARSITVDHHTEFQSRALED